MCTRCSTIIVRPYGNIAEIKKNRLWAYLSDRVLAR